MQFRYVFAVKKKRILAPGVEEAWIDEAFFYSNREEDARTQYLETYGVEAGDLLRREPW